MAARILFGLVLLYGFWPAGLAWFGFMALKSRTHYTTSPRATWIACVFITVLFVGGYALLFR